MIVQIVRHSPYHALAQRSTAYSRLCMQHSEQKALAAAHQSIWLLFVVVVVVVILLHVQIVRHSPYHVLAQRSTAYSRLCMQHSEQKALAAAHQSIWLLFVVVVVVVILLHVQIVRHSPYHVLAQRSTAYSRLCMQHSEQKALAAAHQSIWLLFTLASWEAGCELRCPRFVHTVYAILTILQLYSFFTRTVLSTNRLSSWLV